MKLSKSNKLELQDGSQIAVIGGGPAGSFFAYFALDFAKRLDIDIHIDIYNAKDFSCRGPLGCNHCGGIISESLIQQLSTEGIVLPSSVIRRGIQSYAMHFEQGSALIDTQFHEQRIASMFRGIGPLGSEDNEQKSFDNYLLDMSEKSGASIYLDKVIDMERHKDGIVVKTKGSIEKKYDLVIGAVGLDKKAFQLFKKINPAFVEPKTTKTYIAEFKLDHEKINEYFGNSMHVFLLNQANIKFGALIPKGHFVTLVLLGNNIDKKVVSSFLESKTVGKCFPPGVDINSIMPCQCYPSINIKGAKSAFADRVLLIGDSASSKLYKNGIGAAYVAAKAAARTVIFNGISEKEIKRHYLPTCVELDRDNLIGKLIFIVTTVIQRSGILKRGVLRMVIKEQQKDESKRIMSSVLWNTFTGSAPYSGILKQTLMPAFIANLIKHSVIGIFQKNISYEIRN